jgi:lysophospholipase L1-like esterase
MKRAIFPLILIQIIISVFLVIKIYKQKNDVLGETIYTPIYKKDIVYNPDSELKFFYEPKASTIEEAIIPLSNSIVQNTINSDYLHERFDYLVDKPPNTYRIITLGDSFTFGAFSATVDNYPEQLEQSLNNLCSSNQKFEVINLGVGGYDIQYSIERYFLRGQKYSPDMIIFLLKGDDFIDIKELTEARQRYYYEKIGSEKIKEFSEMGTWLHTDIALQEFRENYGEDDIRNYQKIQIERLVTNFNGKIVIPFWYNIDKKSEQIIKEVTEKYPENTNSFKLSSSYAYPETLHSDYHPTSSGYKLIAKSIFEYLLEESLIPCN